MQPDFPDELLSAFVDDELSPEERALVEQRLAASEADRRLVAELKSLRSDLAALPQVSVRPDFADRVVAAARAAAAEPGNEVAAPVVGPPARPRRAAPLILGAAAVGAIATCVLLFFQSWRPAASSLPDGWIAADGSEKGGVREPSVRDNVAEPPAEDANPAGRLIAALLPAASAANGEAILLRLRVSAGVNLAESLEAALAAAGIPRAPEGEATPAFVPALVQAYRQDLAARLGQASSGALATELAERTVPAAEALVAEAPLDKLQAALSALAEAAHQPLQLAEHRRIRLEAAEGEFDRTRGSSQTIVQRVRGDWFRLEKAPRTVPPESLSIPASPPDLQRPVRVLILFEQQ